MVDFSSSAMDPRSWKRKVPKGVLVSRGSVADLIDTPNAVKAV
jgi:hypothetical protein